MVPSLLVLARSNSQPITFIGYGRQYRAAVAGVAPCSYGLSFAWTAILKGNSRTAEYSSIPSVVFALWRLTLVGMLEAEARSKRLRFKVNSAETSHWYSSRRIAERVSGYKIFYLSEWFPSDARARAIARVMIAIPVSGMIGGPISGALMGLNGWLGLTGWQLLFLIEGVPAVVLGLAVLRFLPDGPKDAAWLEPEQRKWLIERLAIERGQCADRHGYSVAQALSSGVVWQLGLLVFLSISFGQYALGLWLPQIVKDFSGLSNLEVGLVSAIPNFFAVIAMVAVAAHSDRTGERCLHIAASSAAAAVGFLGSALVQSPVLAVMFLSLASAGLLSAHGPAWPLPSKFLSGRAAAGGIALINSLANLSGFVGPYAIGLLNGASGNFRSGLLLLALVPLGGMVLALRLKHAAVLRDVK